MLDQQRLPTSPSHQAPRDSGTGSASANTVGAAQGSEAWLDQQSESLGNADFQGLLASEDGAGAAPDFQALPASSRGGFTARLLAALGRSDSPEDILSSGQYERAATRAEAAVILARVLGLGDTLKGQPAVFSDLPLGHWAAPAVYRGQEEGLLTGAGQGRFNPDGALTDEHAAVFVSRAKTPSARVDFQRDEAVAASEAHRELPEGGEDKADGPMRLTRGVYDKHARMSSQAELDLSDGSHAWAMGAFKKLWQNHRARYEAVAAKTNIPAPLIAALHMRESSGKFNTYLHQGDPLGRPAVNHPRNIPIFHVWEDAAVHALNMKGYLRDDLGMSAGTTDLVAMATFAEHYNGLGYHNKGRVSPYVYAGTDQYDKGKYVADGKFDPNARDKQLGVLAMLQGIGAGQAGPGTLIEGQIVREGQPVASAQVVIVDAKGQRFETTASARGFFSLDDGAAAGRATIEVEGVRQPLDVQGGGVSWTHFHLDAPAPMPQVEPPVATPSAGLKLELGGALLRRGAKGAQVRTLQELLNRHGASLTVDGDFGPGTERAVKSFQGARGLSADGVVGRQTAEALNQAPRGSGQAEAGGAQSGAGSTPPPQTTGAANPLSSLQGTLRRGAKGDLVRALQERLNAHGAGIGVDGDFGPGTERAVRAFQSMTGLTVDGVVGRNTVSKLLQAPGQLPATGQQQTGGGASSGGGPAPDGSGGLTEQRGALAAKSARIEYLRGRAMYGTGSWETQGTNRGALVNEFKTSSGAGGDNGYAWCGMFVGHHYKKAGIRTEILRNLVFWSGLRLHEFFTRGGYVATRQARAGDWWKPHQTASLRGLSGARRKEALDAYGVQEGDIVLFRSDYSHVAMVTGYDSATGELRIIEGNRGNKVQATAYGTGDDEITFIGRFNDADFEPGGAPDASLVNANDPRVNHSDRKATSVT